ncbi:MAG: rod shape-determining protein MreC [PVC group bacterium]|nr:rod shape-determining protein MreC [PVC group bacterium]
MFKQKKPLLIIPVVIVFFLIFIIPSHKSVHLKSSFLWLFKTPLALMNKISLVLSNSSDVLGSFSKYKKTKKELEFLQFKQTQLEEMRLENERLRNMLELKEKKEHDFVIAQVIGKEPTNWLNSIIINKGHSQGIMINQPVMTFAGLVGKVIELSSAEAKVLLISDVNSRVIVLVQRTRDEGILEGIGRGLCRLKYLPVESNVKLGDIVISAGVGGVYPKGLLIGKIESIKIERGGIYKNCIVKPSASLSGLEEILCLKSGLEQ